jgi:hypothetical protein
LLASDEGPHPSTFPIAIERGTGTDGGYFRISEYVYGMTTAAVHLAMASIRAWGR